ncbi:hypothetical protein RJ55_08252 [Drechmeria coniospora]|nr:hypothetical protein RJ55_08252 [Drechmeria coniospora]
MPSSFLAILASPDLGHLGPARASRSAPFCLCPSIHRVSSHCTHHLVTCPLPARPTRCLGYGRWTTACLPALAFAHAPCWLPSGTRTPALPSDERKADTAQQHRTARQPARQPDTTAHDAIRAVHSSARSTSKGTTTTQRRHSDDMTRHDTTRNDTIRRGTTTDGDGTASTYRGRYLPTMLLPPAAAPEKILDPGRTWSRRH